MIAKYYLFVDKNDKNIRYYYRYLDGVRIEIAFAGQVIRIEKANRPLPGEFDSPGYEITEIDSYEFDKQLTLAKMLLK